MEDRENVTGEEQGGGAAGVHGGAAVEVDGDLNTGVADIKTSTK